MAAELVAQTGSFIRLVEAFDFLARETADQQPFLIDRLIPSQSQTIWQGRPKVGKSHSLLQLCCDAAAGIPVFGQFTVPRPVRACYVEMEEPEAITKARLLRIVSGGVVPSEGMLRFLSRNDLYRWRLLPRELLAGHLRDFCQALRDTGTELIVLIAVRKFLGGDQNESLVAEELNARLEELREETGAAILIANHNRKSSASTAEARGFGSTMFAADADAIFDFRRDKGDIRRVEIESRYDAPHELFLSKVSEQDGELIRVVNDPDSERKQALETRMSQGKSLRQAAKESGVPYTTAYRLVNG